MSIRGDQRPTGPAAVTRRFASQALMPLADAAARLLGGVSPVTPGRLALREAVGSRLAADLSAETDLPRHASALRDGWAVSADAVMGAAPHAPVLLMRRPVWVDAGAVLPAGTDTILEPDAIPDPEAVAGRIAVVADAPEGDGVRPAGGEIGRGGVIAAAGTRLTPLRAMASRAAGHARVEVRVPRIRLIATGAHADAACAALAALIAADGGDATEESVTGDAAAIATSLRAGSDADTIFVVGGTGFGRGDHSAAALALAGEVTAHGIALNPGRSAGLGILAGRPVLLVPGRPDAALAVYLTLGRPLLATLAGSASPAGECLPLLRKVVSTLGMSEIVFVRRTDAGLEPLGSVDLPLHRLLLAQGAILVPPEREGYGQGHPVEIIAL